MKWPDSVPEYRFSLRAMNGLSDKARKAPQGYTRFPPAPLVLCPLQSPPPTTTAINPQASTLPSCSLLLLSKRISVSLHYRSLGQELLHLREGVGEGSVCIVCLCVVVVVGVI